MTNLQRSHAELRAAVIPGGNGACVASAQPAAEAVALTHATVIDGTGAAPMADSLVLVRGGRIAAVYSAGSRPVPDGARVEDLTGKWVMPGIIDAHVHLPGGRA
ncbi:MAG: hypothetical protein ABSH49_32965 [Bryobacteraceae bacterium]